MEADLPVVSACPLPMATLATAIASVLETSSLVIGAQGAVLAQAVQAQVPAVSGHNLGTSPVQKLMAQASASVAEDQGEPMDVASVVTLLPEARVVPLQCERAHGPASVHGEVDLASLDALGDELLREALRPLVDATAAHPPGSLGEDVQDDFNLLQLGRADDEGWHISMFSGMEE